jgi:hypothetical protein
MNGVQANTVAHVSEINAAIRAELDALASK